jgi:hypothetical protein
MDRLATPEDVGQDLTGVEFPFYLKDDFPRQNVNFSVCQANSGSMGKEVPTTTWKFENGTQQV